MMETTESKAAEVREILSPEEMAGYLGISRTFAYTLLRNGIIPSFKLARLRKVRKADVDAYVKEQLSATR